jgi:D-sedoheptulose 7-phosphate isomerase
MLSDIDRAAQLFIATLKRGGTIFACGNGGSADQANHFVGELVGCYQEIRRPLRATSLCTNIVTLTAIANDFGYDHVFFRQLMGLGKKGDSLLALSTSGTSENVVKAAKYAVNHGISVVSMVGMRKSDEFYKDHLYQCSDILLQHEDITPYAQEEHLKWIHQLCDKIEKSVLQY